MKTKDKFCTCPQCHPFSAVWSVAILLLLGVLGSSAQTGTYLFTGSETNITLDPGTYNITAYGAQGGSGGYSGGLGARIEGEFNLATATTLNLLVGGSGGNSSLTGGGGGGSSFVVNGTTPLVVAGGGGGGARLTSSEAGGGGGGIDSSGGNGGGSYGGGSGGGGGGGGAGGAGIYYVSGKGFEYITLSGGGGGGYSGAGGGGGFSGIGGSGGSSYLTGGSGGSGYGSGGGGGYGGGGGGSGGGGGGGGYSGGGGGSGTYSGTTGYGGGGGGGSYIDPSAVAIIAEVSGVSSPDGSPNGEIIITSVPKLTLALTSTAGGQFGFNITGPTNATIVVEACTNLANPVWIPVATNALSNGTNYFSDTHWTNYPFRFYRVSEP